MLNNETPTKLKKQIPSEIASFQVWIIVESTVARRNRFHRKSIASFQVWGSVITRRTTRITIMSCDAAVAGDIYFSDSRGVKKLHDMSKKVRTSQEQSKISRGNCRRNPLYENFISASKESIEPIKIKATPRATNRCGFSTLMIMKSKNMKTGRGASNICKREIERYRNSEFSVAMLEAERISKCNIRFKSTSTLVPFRTS